MIERYAVRDHMGAATQSVQRWKSKGCMQKRFTSRQVRADYTAPIAHESRFGFPSRTGWCDIIELVSQSDSFSWFRPITGDLDHGRVEVEGLGDLLMLAGYSYLGLNRRPEITDAIVEAINQFGAGSSGSRWLAGHSILHEELEGRLASAHDAEDAVTFGSGFSTNLATISSLVGAGDAVFGDRVNHASLIDGCLASGARFRRFPHNDMDRLERALADAPEARKLVVVDGVASMSGDVCDLPGLVSLCSQYEALLMVDECHSHFVVGDTGRGVREHFGLEDSAIVDIEMGSLGKALYASGGYVVGSSDICDFLRRSARGFIYSGSLSIADVAAAIAALKIVENEGPELVGKIRTNRQAFVSALAEKGFEVADLPSPIVAIHVGPAVAAAMAAAECQRNGVFIHPVFPPVVPPESSILRASIMASHREDDLREAAGVIADQVGIALEKVPDEERFLL